MHYKKSNFSRILLSAVALLAIFSVAVGITYCWIEGGTTYSIKTENVGDVKTDTVPGNVDYSGTVTLNPASSVTLEDLVNYDENTNQHQSLYFSPVSSADGTNFFFPVAFGEDGTATAYREANTNDVGTKFINYDFDVKAAKKCYLAFNGAPTITATKSGSPVSDTSAFRIMIKCGGKSYFFTTADEELSSTVVTDTKGTTASLTAVPFTNYLYNINKTNKLVTYDKDAVDNIEVSVWLDSASATSNLFGCDVKITLDLVVDSENVNVTFDAVTYNKTGNKETNGFTGGSIKYGGTTHTSTITDAGTSFSATAVANDGYKFVGWYSDAACSDSNLVSQSASLSITPDDDSNYYAKFQENNTTTIYAEARSGFSTYSIWAYQEDGTTTNHYSGTVWPGESATYDSETGYYKYEFTTTDTGTFNVIISNNGGSQYPGPDEEGLEGTLGGTYLFTADNELVEFDPADMITVNVSALTGGSATVNGGTASVKVLSGGSVTLKATPSSGYGFVGWYKDSAGTTTIGSTYATASQTVTVTGDAGSTVTYYAKFIKAYTAKAYAVTDGTSSSSTGGTVKVASSAAGATATATVNSGSSVTFTATAKSGYEFTGWYTAATGGTLKSSSASYAVSNVTANTTLYARFEKTAYTLDVGVIYYLKENSTITQVYYWCDDGTSGTINLSSLTSTTKSYSVGSSYWSGVAQKFYRYTIEVPENVSGIKFKSSSGWYGSDVKDFEDGKIDLIFEWSGNYINYRTTY